MRRHLVVIVLASVVSCSQRSATDVEVVLPETLALSELAPGFQEYLRATVEIAGVIGETPIAIDVAANRLTGEVDLPDRGTLDAELELRVYGRFGENRPEVLLARLIESIRLDTSTENRPALSAPFVSSGEPIFDVNRNGVSNYGDLLAEVDPSPPSPFINTEPDSLQLSATLFSQGNRQIVAVENLSNRPVNIWAFVSDAPGVYLSLVESADDDAVGPVSRRIASAEEPISLSPFASRFLAVSFAPPNSFFLTGAVILKARDPRSGVEQSQEITLVGNADGRPQPIPPSYVQPTAPGAVAGLSTPLVAFPADALFSGFPISNVDPELRTSLRYTGNRLGEFGADAAFYLEVPPRYRFYSWITGLEVDVDLALVPLDGEGNPELGNVVADRSSGPGPEAIQLNPANETRRFVLLLGVQAPELSETQRLALDELPFQLTAHVVTGPDFDPVAPVDPSAGELAGGESVTVRGSGFSPNVRVFFGETEARVTSVTADGDAITVVAPPRSRAIGVQRVDVRVQNPSEIGELVQQMLLPAGFAYLPPGPRVDAIEPAVATRGGGTALRILGDAFTDDSEAPTVLLGGVAATAVSRVSDTELIASSPPLDPGTYDLEVLVTFRVTGATSSKQVVVQDAVAVQNAELPPPVVESVCDQLLPVDGTCAAVPRISSTQRPTLYIQGTGFVSGATARIGTKTVGSINFINSEQLELSPPDNPLGILPVTVFNPDGQSSTFVAAVSYVQDCELTPEGCPFCGNGRVDAGEDCDGTDLDGRSCLAIGFADGILSCDENCEYDTSECQTCGNGRIDAGEQCDGDTPQGLGGRACNDFGFSGGTLACTTGCNYDFGGCRLCGNSLAEGTPGEFGAEVCDRNDLRGATCASQGFFAGALACRTDCNGFDLTNCTNCGNGFRDSGEECDGDALNGQSCQSLVGLGGDLACSAACTFDVSDCNTCGDGTVQSGTEDCDGADLQGTSCESFGYSGGDLGCRPQDCRYDFNQCYICGNGRRDPGEPCEGTNLGGLECDDFQFLSGTLGCTSECQLDFSSCNRCGNGVCDQEETNTAAGVRCVTDCPLTSCGNGTCDAGELPGTCPYDCPWQPPFSATLTSGSGLSGLISRGAGGLIEIRVTDTGGAPVPNLLVEFVAPPGAHIVPAVVSTNSDGRAAANPTLGLTPGLQTFTVTARDFEGQEIATADVDLQANDVPPGTVIPVLNQSGLAGATVPSTGAGTAFRLSQPYRIAVGPPGSPYEDDLFVADRNNDRVLRMEPSGYTTVFAGGNGRGTLGDGGQASAAQLSLPSAVAVAPNGTVYIVEQGSVRIRQVAPDGTVGTLAQGGASGSCASGLSDPPLATELSIDDIAVRSDGTLFWSEVNCRYLRSLLPGGLIERVYSNGVSAQNPTTSWYYGIGFDAAGNLVAGGFDSAGASASRYTLAREIDGVLTRIAGNLVSESPIYFSASIGSAAFGRPDALVQERAGSFLVMDAGTAGIETLWRVALDGYMERLTNVSGAATAPSFSPVDLEDQQFGQSFSIDQDSRGNLYVQDLAHHAVFMVRALEATTRPVFNVSVPDPASTTVNAPSPENTRVTVTVDGAPPRGRLDVSILPQTEGGFATITGGRTLPDGSLVTNLWAGRAPGAYDYGFEVLNIEGILGTAVANATARALISDQWVPAINSNAQVGAPAAGPASQTFLDQPQFVETDDDGTLYITSFNSRRLVAVSPAGATRILAGNGSATRSGLSGPARLATFNQPAGLARDGNLLHLATQYEVLTVDLDAAPEPVIFPSAGAYSFGCNFIDSMGTVTSGSTGVALNAQFIRTHAVEVNPSEPGVFYIVDGVYPFDGGCRTISRVEGTQLTRVLIGRANINVCAENTFYYLTGAITFDDEGTMYLGVTDSLGGNCPSVLGIGSVNLVYKVVSLDPLVLDRVLGGGLTTVPNGIPGRDAEIGPAFDLAFGPDGALYVSDYEVVYRVENVKSSDPAARLTTVFSGAGASTVTVDPVPRLDATHAEPRGLAFGADGTLYVVEHDRGMVRALSP